MPQTHAHMVQNSKMADGDEEDFFALGTPFEQLEEDAPRKKPVPIHEQVVTDDRGRRRFHGAFTGGFSAGYFNTVDTKEGWTPKTFISSRSQKASERGTQRPEDFMDEEDLSEFGIAPKRVVTTEKFLPSRRDDSTSGKIPSGGSGGAGSAVLGANLLQDLIVPVKMSVGIKLLSQMGWKEGQGVGPRVRREAKKTYGCIGPPGTGPDGEDDIYAVGLFFAPKDVESLEFTSKDDFHGIGYSGINPKTALLSQTDWLGMGTSASSIGIRGKGFGVGALEEDDEDIYAQDNLSKYDIDLNTTKSQRRNDLHGWSGPQQSSGQGGMLSIFCKASKPPPARKHYPPPVVPRDFKPFHKTEETTQAKQPLSGPPVNQGQKRQEANQTSKRLTAKERGEALGEVPLPTPKKSIFDYIAEEDKTRLKESKEKANTSKQRSSKLLENNDLDRRFTSRGPLSTSGFKPFAKEPEKQARYEIYLSGKSDRDMSSQTGSKMTEWERECEQEEFARAASLYRPLSQTMAARFTSAKDTDEKPSGEESGKEDQPTAAKMKMFGALTRERFEWHPDRILCKRFNIPDPYPGAGVTGVVMDRRDKPKTDESVIREVKAIEYKPHLSEPGDETKSTGHQDEAEMVQKPSALVAGFQSIVSQRKQPSYQGRTEQTNKEEQNKPEQNTDADVIKRAPMDLFNEIFAESSSESESESEENEEAEQTKTIDLDVQDNEERNEKSIEKKDAPPFSNAPVLVPEGSTVPETLEREKEPSPHTFGPALPSAFGGNSTRTSKGFDSSTRVDSPRRQEKQKRRKKKRRKEKETGSDLSDSDDGYSRRRKDKKKRSKKKGSDFTDSDEEYKKKKRKKKAKGKETDSEWSDSDEKDTRKKKKKTSAKYTDKNLTDSEDEEFTRSKKKKTRSTHNDSDEKYDKQKTNKRGKDDSDDESSKEKYNKHRKKKRKDKEKSVKERKKYSDKTNKSDRQEYEEIQYEPEKYVEKAARNVAEKPLNTFGSPESSGYRKSNNHGKVKDGSEEKSKKDARNSTNSRTDNDSAKEQEISRVPDSKEIINKLKNIQMLKEKKRMRAADFM